jgi:hypothetical protein
MIAAASCWIRSLRPAAVFDQEFRPPIRPGPGPNAAALVLITDEIEIAVTGPVTHDQPLGDQPRDSVPQSSSTLSNGPPARWSGPSQLGVVDIVGRYYR